MQETTMKDKIKEKINKIKNKIKKTLNYYLIDTTHYKLEVEDGNPKYILKIQTWAGPRKGLGFVAKELARLLKENGVTEIGKIIIEYELIRRKERMIARVNLGEKISEALSQKLKKPEK